MSTFDTPRLRSSQPAVDIDGFFTVVGKAIKTELDNGNVSEDRRPLYTEDWPKERLAQPNAPFDFIGYHVVFSQRASLSNKGYRAPKGVMIFDHRPSKKNAGYIEVDTGWIEEALVQFTIFTPSNARSRDLMKFLQNVILKYTFNKFFMGHGINHLVFHRRLEDTIETTQNQDLYTRRLQYIVRVQNITTLEAKSLESVKINLGSPDDEVSSYSLPPE